MSMSKPSCLIWGTPVASISPAPTAQSGLVVKNSPRAGGDYAVLGPAVKGLQGLELPHQLNITNWLVHQRESGVDVPTITTEKYLQIRADGQSSVQTRAERLLCHFIKQSKRIGATIAIALPGGNPIRSYETLGDVPDSVLQLWGAMAISEADTPDEVEFLVEHLARAGMVSSQGERPTEITVSVPGYEYVDEASVATQAFVAMWFNHETNDAYEQGVRSGIEDAGFNAMRIDRKEHVNKIDDEIIAEIRRSRFLVADFSQGKDGARGGVYFEAGFALGLGIPVIYTCRGSDIDKLHFDTRQYNHIVWDSPQQLREALKNRILAVIGEGPNMRSGG